MSVDLSRELARRLGVPNELVTHDAGKVVEGLKAGAGDARVRRIDPARAVDVSFTAAYVVIEGAYLVPQNSPICSNDDVDRPRARRRRRRTLRLVPYAKPETSQDRSCTNLSGRHRYVRRASLKSQPASNSSSKPTRGASRLAPARRRTLHGDQPGNGYA